MTFRTICLIYKVFACVRVMWKCQMFRLHVKLLDVRFAVEFSLVIRNTKENISEHNVYQFAWCSFEIL